MKKIFLLIIVTFCIGKVNAQRTHTAAEILYSYNPHHFSTERTTAIGDTLTLKNTNDTNTVALYRLGSVDTGYATGTNFWGDESFAERYIVNGNDSSITVLGVVAEFGGKVNPMSSKTISIKIWDMSLAYVISPTYIYSGFPNNILDSAVFPITQLGIGVGTDTMKVFLFPDSALTRLSYSFYAGYSIIYNFDSLNGDTIGLASTLNGMRSTPVDTVFQYIQLGGDTVIDTIINVQNCTQWSDNNWHENYTDNDSLFNNLIIYPIVRIDSPTMVIGVNRRNLTLFGIFPNPAVDYAHVKFSVKEATDVTIQILDLSGRFQYTTTYERISSGEHNMLLPVSQLAAGNYTCLVRTSGGAGIATLLTVVK